MGRIAKPVNTRFEKRMMGPMSEKEVSQRVPKSCVGGKKPYQKPSYHHERVFETMALACGKISPSQLQCKSARKSS